MSRQNEGRPTPAQLVALIAEGWLPPEDARRSAERWGEVAAHNRRLREAIEAAFVWAYALEAGEEGSAALQKLRVDAAKKRRAALANTPAEEDPEVTRLRAELEAKSHGLFVADQVVAGLRAQVAGMRAALSDIPTNALALFVTVSSGTTADGDVYVELVGILPKIRAALSQPPVPAPAPRYHPPGVMIDAKPWKADAGLDAASLGGWLAPKDADALRAERDALKARNTTLERNIVAQEEHHQAERANLKARVKELEGTNERLRGFLANAERLCDQKGEEIARLREASREALEALEAAEKWRLSGGGHVFAWSVSPAILKLHALLEPAKGEEKEAPDER